MVLKWSAVRNTGRGAYAEWEAAAIGTVRWWTYFLRCSVERPGPEIIDELLTSSGLLLPPEEIIWLRRVRAMLKSDGKVGPLWTAVALQEGDEQKLPASWEVRHVGPPARQAPFHRGRASENWAKPWILTKRDTKAPILGIIDDGLAYLHDRFQSEGGTRVAAFWRQGAPGEPVLRNVDIDARSRSNRTEAEIYAADAADRVPGLAPRMESRRVSHGTFVADLAGGAGAYRRNDLAMRRVPILAVELPTPAVADSSGRRLEPYVARALRWIVTEAIRMAGRHGRHPLVVNLSLGSLAGPAEAACFLIDLIRDEAERYMRHAGAPMRLVAAYGNERLARLAARSEVRPEAPFSCLWRLPPDDRTASFLELHVEGAARKDLKILLTPPGESTPSLEVPWPASGTGYSALPHALLMGKGRAPPALLLAVAPTAGLDARWLGQTGPWRIEVRSRVAGVRVVARVQRDETLQGHWLAGRQSWLDGQVERGWSTESRDWTAPGPSDPVTTEGTGATCARTGEPILLFAGAAHRTSNGDVIPADYSGEGSPVSGSPGPTLSAICSDGASTAGRLAAGRLSGTKVRMRGTSVAAALVTRRLLEAYSRYGPEMSKDQSAVALFGREGPGPLDPRLGRGVLAEDF